MIIEFSLGEDDFLVQQLYATSKSEPFKKSRKRYRNIVAGAAVLIGVIFLTVHMYLLSVFFLAFAVVWFLAMPRWQNKTYSKHLRNHVREHFKNRFGKKVSITLESDQVVFAEEGHEIKMHSTEVAEMMEVPSNIFIQLKSGHWLIIPKTKRKETEGIAGKLKELASVWNIRYVDDHKWEWK